MERLQKGTVIMSFMPNHVLNYGSLYPGPQLSNCHGIRATALKDLHNSFLGPVISV